MDETRRNQIYDRLGKIKMNLDPKNVIDPRYISEKIGMCHVFTEEVESFYLEVSKELSIKQRALMNSEAAFEQAKDEMMINDTTISTLPNIKDREARANNQLKPDKNEIKFYKIDVIELEGLLGAINLKLRNLDRLNKDIKAQLRLMESQIRLGQADPNIQTKDLIEAMKAEGARNMFQDAKSTSEEEVILDPTADLDITRLLKTEEAEDPTTEEDDETAAEDILVATSAENNEADSTAADITVVDLDTLFTNPKPLQMGGDREKLVTTEVLVATPAVVQVEPTHNMAQKSIDGFGLDTLLAQFN